MLKNFEEFWSALRVIAIGIFIVLWSADTFAFAPIVDIKVPSKQGEQMKAEEQNRRNEKAWHKVDDYHRNQNNDNDSGRDYEKPSGRDYSEAIDYERNNIG
ncbi:MAG: hypothetical protein ABSA17_09270 [Rhabdochlamydiaceae bacterium]|jgi:hypothetical protein